jgi:hypothetical protein
MNDTPAILSPATNRLRRDLLALLMAWLMLYVGIEFVVTIFVESTFRGDAAQHVFWTYRYVDPVLFPGDLSATYFSQPHFASVGWRVLFKLLAPLIDPQALSESIAVLLVVPTLVFAGLIGRHVGGWLGAVVGLTLLVYLGHLELLAGGFARSFALPIVLMGVWCVLDRRIGWFGVSLVLGAVFYAPTVLILSAFAACNWLLHAIIDRRLVPVALNPVGRRSWVTLLAGGLMAAGVIGASYLRPLPPEIGSHYTVDEARQMPEYQRGGRTAFFRPWHIRFFHQAYAGMGLTTRNAAAFGVALALSLALFRRTVPIEMLALLLSSLAMFALAHLLLFKLYLPSRYTLYVFPVVATLWSAWLVGSMRGRRLRSMVGLLVGLMIVHHSLGLVKRYMPTFWDDDPSPEHAIGKESAYVFARTLPIDTLIAAHPDDANDIPLRSRRMVLANTETTNAWHRGYYGVMAVRLADSFRLLYSDSWTDADAIADRHGVDLIWVNQRRFASPDAADYHPPFGETSRRLFDRGNFVFKDPPASRIVFQQDDIRLVRVGTEQP